MLEKVYGGLDVELSMCLILKKETANYECENKEEKSLNKAINQIMQDLKLRTNEPSNYNTRALGDHEEVLEQ